MNVGAPTHEARDQSAGPKAHDWNELLPCVAELRIPNDAVLKQSDRGAYLEYKLGKGVSVQVRGMVDELLRQQRIKGPVRLLARYQKGSMCSTLDDFLVEMTLEPEKDLLPTHKLTFHSLRADYKPEPRRDLCWGVGQGVVVARRISLGD